ncbi:unnamed protein product [Knipowitschia caucasica]
MVSNYRVPPKFDEARPYECWKNEVSIWRLVTELDKTKQALAVALGLEGRESQRNGAGNIRGGFKQR